MNAYEKSIALGLTGSDDEIVSVLQSTGVTATKIDLVYLMELLNFRGMLRKTDGSNGQERWVGTLQNIKSALVSFGQTKAVTAYETWFSHVTNPRQTHWDTSKPEYAGFWAMRSSFADGQGMPSLSDFAAVASLGGGWLFADLTEDQFAAQRQAAIDAELASVLSQQWATIQNELINPAVSDRAALIAALKSAIETLEKF